MITSGFYNSKEHDRLYDADQFGAMFDGLIHDGIFFNVGDRFMPRLGEKNSIIIGSGRAWFIHRWVLNSTDYVVKLPPVEVADRIDTIVIEVNKTDEVRDSFIKVIKGEPGPNPKPAELTQNDQIGQYPLCHVTVRSTGGIGVKDLEILVGQTPCPFVTGVVSSMSIDALIARWEQEWNDEMHEWDDQMAQQQTDWTAQMADQNDTFQESKKAWDDKMGDWTAQMAQQKTDWEEQTEQQQTDWTTQTTTQQTEFSAQLTQQSEDWTAQTESQKESFDQSLADQNAAWTTQMENQSTQFGIQMGTQQNEFGELKTELEGVSKGLTEYLVCETAGNVAEKVVECEGFVLKTGVKVVVRFTNGNTATSPTLKIGETEAKGITYKKLPISNYGTFSDRTTIMFQYDGAEWDVVGDFTFLNSQQISGSVPAGLNHNGQFYGTDMSGNPSWRDSFPKQISFEKGFKVIDLPDCSVNKQTLFCTITANWNYYPSCSIEAFSDHWGYFTVDIAFNQTSNSTFEEKSKVTILNFHVNRIYNPPLPFGFALKVSNGWEIYMYRMQYDHTRIISVCTSNIDELDSMNVVFPKSLKTVESIPSEAIHATLTFDALSDGIFHDNAISSCAGAFTLTNNKLTSRLGNEGIGWYRIAKTFNGVGSANDTSFTLPFRVTLCRFYGNKRPEQHVIHGFSSWNAATIQVIESYAFPNEHLITQFRISKEDNVAYMEVYYNHTQSNILSVMINNMKLGDSYWIPIENPPKAPDTDVTLIDKELNAKTSIITTHPDLALTDTEKANVLATLGLDDIKSSDIVKLTRAEYDALPDTKLTDGKIYFISDGGGSVVEVIQAENVVYDNTESGLSADTVQNAIDALVSRIGQVDDSKIDSDNGVATGLLSLTSQNAGQTGNIQWFSEAINIAAGDLGDTRGIWHLSDNANNLDLMSYQPSNRYGTTKGGNKAEIRTDGEGGNVKIAGPSVKQIWEMDNWNDNQLRIYCHENKTDGTFVNHFPFILNPDYIVGITDGNLPFYKIESTNSYISNMAFPEFNGGYSCNSGIINDVGFLGFRVGWIQLQFRLPNNQVQVRMKYGENAWTEWKTLAYW